MHGHLNINLSRCTVTWTSIYHDARSPEHQFITMHGQLNINLSRCTVTWTSIYHDARSPEHQFITMHGHLNINLSRCTGHLNINLSRCTGHLNINLSRCTVTWTSIYHDARSPEHQFITMHGHLNVKFIFESARYTETSIRVYQCIRHIPKHVLNYKVLIKFATFLIKV